MIQPWMIFFVITIIAYSYYYRRDPLRTRIAAISGWQKLLQYTPVLILAVILSGEVNVVIPAKTIREWYGEGAGGIFFATVLGFLLPGPRYAIYPLAAVFLENGASYGAVVSMISSQQLIDFPDGMFVAIEVLGKRFFWIRLAISAIICMLAGAITNLAFEALFL